MKVSIVALARKLAGILYAMWRDGTAFEKREGRTVAVTTWNSSAMLSVRFEHREAVSANDLVAAVHVA